MRAADDLVLDDLPRIHQVAKNLADRCGRVVRASDLAQVAALDALRCAREGRRWFPKRRMIDELRRVNGRRQGTRPAEVSIGDIPRAAEFGAEDRRFAALDDREALDVYLSRLAPDLSRLLRALYVEGRPAREVAEALGTSRWTVNHRRRLALAAIRSRVADRSRGRDPKPQT